MDIFIKIINPIPPITPLTNLRLLLLFLKPKNCVNPSTAVGIIRIMDIINKFKE